tara:strand:- start:1378 stop:1839 length:462 start_codon:yes stop_codon:yes gene_type:complete
MTNEQAIRKLLPKKHAQWVMDRWEEDLNGYYMDDEYDPTDPTLLLDVLEWNDSNRDYLRGLDNYFQYKSEIYFYSGEKPQLPELPKTIKPEDVEAGKLFKINQDGEDGWYLRIRKPDNSNVIAVPYPEEFAVVGIVEGNTLEVTKIIDAPKVD